MNGRTVRLIRRWAHTMRQDPKITRQVYAGLGVEQRRIMRKRMKDDIEDIMSRVDDLATSVAESEGNEGSTDHREEASENRGDVLDPA